MGWFVLAAILGFAAPKAWRTLGPAAGRRIAIAGAAIIGVAIITIGPPWLLFLASSKTAALPTDWIDNPAFTRVLLGLILGAGADYVSREPRPSAGKTGDPNSSSTDDQKPPSAVSLSLAAGIVLLAIVLPYLDAWLSHLAGFKTSLIEIQLTNLSSTSKIVEPIQRQGFNRDVVLETLVVYDELIENDIQYIRRFELKDIEDQNNYGYDPPELKEKKRKRDGQLKQLDSLHAFFKQTVSPAARCFKAAIAGGLSLPAARSRLRDLAGDLTQLIELEAEEKRKPGTSKPGAIVDSHQKVVAELVKATDDISGFVGPANQEDCHPKIDVASALLSTEYDKVPHLDVARALLLIFVDHDRLGREVLREAAKKEFKDFTTPRLLAALMFFRGDSITQYYEMLEDIRKLAGERLTIIKRVSEKCSLCDKEYWAQKLTKWARRAEEIALNNVAYGIAVDVTERRIGAVDMLPIAENCVETLKKADDTAEDDSALDTIGFVTIVAEAQRAKTSSIDKSKINEAIDLLRRAAARDEEALSSESAKGEDVDYSGLKSIQAHLAAAKGLLEQ